MDYPDTARSITKEESDLKQREKSWMRQVFALLEHVFWLKENGIIKKEEFEETWEPLIRGTFEYKEVKPYFREEAYNRKFVDYLKEKKFI
jgi:ribosomal protein L19E